MTCYWCGVSGQCLLGDERLFHKCLPAWDVAFACDDEDSDEPQDEDVLGQVMAPSATGAGQQAAKQIDYVSPDVGDGVYLWVRRKDIRQWALIRVTAEVEYNAQEIPRAHAKEQTP